MRNRKLLSIAAMFALCASVAAGQTTGRVTVLEALREAQAFGGSARASASRVLAAGARLRSAGALTNPVLSVASHFGQNTGGLDEDYLLTQTIELGNKRRQRVNAARADRAAALADRQQAGLDLEYNLRLAYYEAQRADAVKTLAQAAFENAQTIQKAAATQLQAGDVPRSSVVRTSIEVARAQTALDAAVTDRSTRIATLASLMGRQETADVSPADALTFTPMEVSLPALQETALNSRPDLLAARQTLTSREAALRGARAATQPDLFLEARHSSLDPTVGGNSLRFGLLFPVFDFGRTRGDSSAARYGVEEQQAVLAELTRAAKLDVAAAYRALQEARRVIESFRAGRLDRAQELLTMATTGYQHGASTYLELLDAQQVFRTEQTAYVQALADYNIAAAALVRAVGGKLP